MVKPKKVNFLTVLETDLPKLSGLNIIGHYVYACGIIKCLLGYSPFTLSRVTRQETIYFQPTVSTLKNSRKCLEYLIDKKNITGYFLRSIDQSHIPVLIQNMDPGHIHLDSILLNKHFHEFITRIRSQIKQIAIGKPNFQKDSKYTEALDEIKNSVYNVVNRHKLDAIYLKQIMDDAYDGYVIEYTMGL